MLKNKAALWIALGAILLIAIVAIGVTKQMNSRVMAVQLAKVRVEDITSTVRAPGKIEPRTQVKISADIMGKITHLLVKEGDTSALSMETGQMLYFWTHRAG